MMERKTDAKTRSGLDVLVAGGGYVGLAAAVSLKQARPSLGRCAGRCRARRRLATGRPRLGHCRCRLPHARPARRLGRDRAAGAGDHRDDHHRFAQRRSGPPGVPDLRRRSGAGRALCAYGRQQGAERRLARAAPRSSASTSSKVSRCRVSRPTAPASSVHLADGAALTARLLVAADGVNSKLRDMAGIKTVKWEYGQSGIVCTVAHERPHNGRAEEHFLPAGPFAILPLKPATTAPTARRSSGPSATQDADSAGCRRRSRLRA